LGDEAQVQPVSARFDELRMATATIRSFSGFLSLLALLVGGFLVFNFMAMVVSERRQEIAVLLALGETATRIVFRILGEAALIGGAGSLIGIPLGVWTGTELVSRVPAYMEYAYNLKTRVIIPPWGIAAAIAAGIVAAMLGAAITTAAILRWQVAHLLRPQAVAEVPRAAKGHWLINSLALILIVAGIVGGQAKPNYGAWFLCLVFASAIALLPPVSRRALEGIAQALAKAGRAACLIGALLQESLQRSVATAAAAAFSIAAVVAIGGAAENMMRSARPFADAFTAYDYYVSASSNPYVPVPLDPALIRAIGALPSVSAVSPLRGTFVRWKGRRVWLIGEEPEAVAHSKFPYQKGDPISVAEGLGRGDAIISTQIARTAGVSIGDAFDLETPTGRHRYRVAAIARSWSWPEGTITLGDSRFQTDFRYQQINQLRVKFAPGIEPARSREMLASAAPGTYIVSGTSLRDEIYSQLRAQFSAFRLIRAVAVGMVALMVFSSMLLTAMQRRSETGVLRAVGLSRSDVFRVMFGEGLLVGSVGVIAGVLLGILLQVLALSVVAAASGLAFTTSIVLRPIVEAALAGFFAVALGACYPAWKTSRASVVEMIAYE
jgi:putative ABC transport system permease protein